MAHAALPHAAATHTATTRAATARGTVTGIRAVFFDVGETLVDETREYGSWADWLKVPRHTFSSVFGAVIARGRDYRDVFQYFRPGFDLNQERRLRAAAGKAERLGEEDLYPDARRCLAAVRAAGYVVGIAGNQTHEAGTMLLELGLPHDVLVVSAWLGTEKPDPRFFALLAERVRMPPAQILYVGDRIDNDLRPARSIGMRTALVRRGPWATILADHPEAADADLRLSSLAELPGRLGPTPSARGPE